MDDSKVNWDCGPPSPGELRGPPPAPDRGLTVAEIVLGGLRTLASSEAVAQVDAADDSSRSYAWLLETSVRTAAALTALGLGPGHTALLVADHCHLLYPAYLGALFAGLSVAIHPTEPTTDELSRAASICKPRVVFHDAVSEKAVRNCFAETEEPGVRVVSLDVAEGLNTYGSLLLLGQSSCPDSHKAVPIGDRATHPTLVLPTSGSSGMPKWVMISDASFSGRLSLEIQPQTIIVTSPMSWITGSIFFLRSCIAKVRRIFIRNSSPESVLQAVHKYRPLLLFTAPSLLALMAQSPSLSSADPPDVSSLGSIFTAGSPLPPHLSELITRKLGRQPSLGYGMTEAGYIASCRSVHAPPGSSGTLHRGVRLRVVDPVTEEVVTTPMTDGEIRLKTAEMMIGYLNDEEATKACFDADGWFKSGDIGHWDEDGYLYVVNRIKDIFKYRGHHVSPSEVEAVIVRHPGVKEAAVVGLPHSLYGALPTAFVVPTSSDSVSASELDDLVAGTLSDGKKLRGGIVFVESLPKMSNGKINRKFLNCGIQTT